MEFMKLAELVTICNSQGISCDKCTRKEDCSEFKRIIATIKEPWELNRLFKEGAKE